MTVEQDKEFCADCKNVKCYHCGSDLECPNKCCGVPYED